MIKDPSRIWVYTNEAAKTLFGTEWIIVSGRRRQSELELQSLQTGKSRFVTRKTFGMFYTRKSDLIAKHIEDNRS
jgi:hypothetical protein